MSSDQVKGHPIHDAFLSQRPRLFYQAYINVSFGKISNEESELPQSHFDHQREFLRFLNFNLYGSREKLAPVLVLDLTGLKNTVFECVSNLRALLYLNPGETVVHIDIHKFACIISRLYFIS